MMPTRSAMQVMPSAGRVAVPAHKATRSHRRSHVARSQQSETEQTSAPAQNTPKEASPPSSASTLSTLDALLPQPKEAKPPPPPPSAPSQQGTFSSWPTVPKPQSKEAPKKKGSFTFDQVMGFEGLAPEVINSRAAMLGFFFAIKAETTTGESVFAQLLTGGFPAAAAVILAVTVASFAPAIIRQVPMDECFNKDPKKEKSIGPFNANAEIRNGRAAMIGIALILLLEGGSGTAFFI